MVEHPDVVDVDLAEEVEAVTVAAGLFKIEEIDPVYHETLQRHFVDLNVAEQTGVHVEAGSVVNFNVFVDCGVVVNFKQGVTKDDLMLTFVVDAKDF